MVEIVGPGFFRVVGMHLYRGREFTWQDDEHAPPFAIVSDSLGRRLFGDQSPIGRRLDLNDPEIKNAEIVGVVNSASLWNPRTHAPPAVYVPLLQVAELNQPLLEVQIDSSSQRFQQVVGKRIESLGRHYSVRTETLNQRLDNLLGNERLISIVSVVLGAVALLLASIGLYSLISFTVTRRTREIGIRLSLGAEPRHVLVQIGLEFAIVLLAGVTVGIGLAFTAARLLAGVLVGFTSGGVMACCSAVALVALVGLLAGLTPAFRASRLDAMTALRNE
jgi:hypothetical protein